MSGFAPTPALAGYQAEIYEVKLGTSDKTEDEYVMPMMIMAHDDLESGEVKHGEFFALTEDRMGFLKSFLTKIGRCDIMTEDAEWEELVGTQFDCDVSQTTVKKTGKVYANIVHSSIKAISHEFFEIPDEEEPPEEVEEEPEAEEPPKKTRAARGKATKAAGGKKAATRTGGASPRRSPRSRVDR
jgi:hypothetical protein